MGYNDDAYLLGQQNALREAQIRSSSADRPAEVQSLKLDLSNGKSIHDPLAINLDFRSIFVRDASDTSTTIFMKPISRDTQQEAVPMQKNDSFVMPSPVKAYLHWEPQPGKSVTLLLFATGEFRSGSQISQNGGGVSINDGSSAALATTALTANTAAIIAPSKLDRKTALIQNNLGADVFVGGDPSVTTATGIRLPAGAQLAWKNTAALYGISTGAGNVVRLEES